jgi:hypothetical protein
MLMEDSVLTAIWLRLCGEQEVVVQSLIRKCASTYGTVVFEPHLTVCMSEIDEMLVANSVEYVRNSGCLPLRVAARRVAYGMESPFRAVFIDLQEDSILNALQEQLGRIVHAPKLTPPHISLLYAIDGQMRRIDSVMAEETLKDIAEECDRQLRSREFLLGRPVFVSPRVSWDDVGSWVVTREF